MITGSLVALVTPMLENGDIDFNAYRALIDWHIEQGTDAIVAVGTSGESPTVTVDEHCELIKVAVEHARGRIPIIAGAGGNSTREAIALSEFARAAGVYATLQVVPYYNKPTQGRMYQHFKAIALAVDCPVILYNVPGRTVADLSNDTILRLAQIPNIIGIKDASGDVARGIALIKDAPADFAIYSGDDSTAAALILMGAHGNISVTANVAPKAMHDLCQAALDKDVDAVRRLNTPLCDLNKNLFIEANPIPVKWALHAMQKITLGTRLPLTPLSETAQPVVHQAMTRANLI
ncbi:4-hydroxy-tetrahydrodipicolinate synthase-like [Daphnia magna]|uniref:4-hydroxy-tetrahydrodipicolinate synthase-like n=1 Tax=Daphnia magna TaxID=35525 RepID=UPI001E1BD7B2|nr:4-hydroxy-tetrahydrodipicolinate synthase-like [Daphnia magna]